MKNDRITVGAIAGIVGAIMQNIYGLIAKGLKLTDRDFVEFAQVMMFYKPTGGLLGFAVATIAHITFGLILGALFSIVVRQTSSAYFYLKAMGFGVVVWFWCFAFGTFFNLPKFKVSPPGPSLVLFAGALLWGLVTGYALKLLESKTDLV